MKNLLYSAIKNNASDILLTAGCRPVLRINGELNKLQSDVLKPADTQKLLFSVINRRQRTVFEEERELDFALTLNLGEIEKSKNTKPRRFRLNGFFQRGNTAIAVRVINQNIPSAKELGIPDAVLELADLKQGLILVTGPTGHGKSTTLASLIDRINHSRYSHIITVEDPIEYVHENINSVIEQREVHSDTVSFANALKYVLRQDPDVILVGEMRDTETISAALTAAETGHLVMATLHTNNAPQTIDRIVDSFPQHQQNQIRLQLAGCLAAVIAQRLLPRIDGSGRVAAFEILKAHSGVSALIRDGKTHQIQSLIETNAKGGMVTMEKALLNLYEQGLIDRESSKSFF
jgi:twitching motility protein PilT